MMDVRGNRIPFNTQKQGAYKREEETTSPLKAQSISRKMRRSKRAREPKNVRVSN